MYGLVSSPIISSQQSPPANIIPANYDYPGNANYIPNTSQQQRPNRQIIHVDSSPRDSEISRVMVPNGDQVIFSAEDRYYTSSTAPAGNNRPDAYNSSRY
ncbi:hypothetical protein CAEBREN_19937 [Caenorhabditis brenneri]|uniref:Uncharacterized protein n=1 Tax=Caenorhabditis brenneri TaxID=135651 RepID=G0NKG5_CAEBE|nr:hypothetical protein CAEBREN_19937 [Caenorhabditis brenneri]